MDYQKDSKVKPEYEALAAVSQAVETAFGLLPRQMDTVAARVLMYAIGLQESRFIHRFQVVAFRPGVRGPARGFWQFEAGGGVKGVMNHPTSRYWANYICGLRDVVFDQVKIHKALEKDDVLAAAFARLLIFTDAKRLPGVNEVDAAWALYAERCWRPGKPHPESWAGNHRLALEFVFSGGM